MANLTLYVDRGPRSELAKVQLNDAGIVYDVVNVEETPEVLALLESRGRDRAHYPMPQYYVGETVAFNSFKEVNFLTAKQINDRIGELNA